MLFRGSHFVENLLWSKLSKYSFCFPFLCKGIFIMPVFLFVMALYSIALLNNATFYDSIA